MAGLCSTLLVVSWMLLSGGTAGDEGWKCEVPGNKLGEALELRVLAAEPLVAPFRDAFYPPVGRILGQRAWERRPGPEDNLLWPLDLLAEREEARLLFPVVEDEQRAIGPEALVERLVVAAGENGWEGGRGMLEYSRGRMLALQEPAILDQAAARIEKLRLAMTPRFAIRYLLYTAPSGDEAQAQRTVLTLGEAEALWDRVHSANFAGRRIHAARATGRAGDCFGLGEHVRVAMQTDLEVEIAQESAIAEPMVEPLLLGQSLNVTPILCPDDRSLALMGLFTWRENPQQLRAVDCGARDVKSVELAVLPQQQQAFSARLPGEGGLLLYPGGSVRPDLRALVEIRRLDPRPQFTSEEAVVPLSTLTTRNLTCEDFGLAGIETAPQQMEKVVELINTSVFKEDENFHIDTTPDYLCVRAPAASVKAVKQLVQFLGRDHQRSYRLEVVREARPLEKNDRGSWRRLGQPVELAGLGGRIAFAQTGFEQLFIGDFSTEVASKSRIGDPVTFTCFDGVQAVASFAMVQKQVHVRLALLDRSVLGFRTLPVGSPELGAAQVPEIREVVLRRTLVLTPGETLLLGDGPERNVDGLGRCATRLWVRVTVW